jgi:hypothetical protein
VSIHAQQKIVVDLTGKGNFTSIQSAINSLSDSAKKKEAFLLKMEFIERRFS